MTWDQQKAMVAGKIAALVALLAFVLLPQVSCAGLGVNGWDCAVNRFDDTEMMFIAWLAILAGLGAFFSKKPTALLGYGILGLAAVVISLFKLKAPSAAAPKELQEIAVRVEPGGFLTTMGFLGTTVAGWLGRAKRVMSWGPGGKGVKGRQVLPKEASAKPTEVVQPAEGAGDFTRAIASSIQTFLRAPYEAMPQKTGDRLVVFYGCAGVCFIMALSFLVNIGGLGHMAGGTGVWVGLSLPISVGGIWWLIHSYRHNLYPFDPKPPESEES